MSELKDIINRYQVVISIQKQYREAIKMRWIQRDEEYSKKLFDIVCKTNEELKEIGRKEIQRLFPEWKDICTGTQDRTWDIIEILEKFII
jgi:DNA-directed RNA polymerase subunit F